MVFEMKAFARGTKAFDYANIEDCLLKFSFYGIRVRILGI